METLQRNRGLSIANGIAFIGMLVVNILATTLPLNDLTTGDLSDALPNLFVPIGLTFSIWGVIWLLLAVYLVIQIRGAFSSPPANDVDDPFSASVVGPWFAANMILNAGWIFAWHYQLIGVSVLIMFALLATLIAMFLRVDRAVSGNPRRWFARVPISVYFGWITIATIANITAFLVSVGWGGFGVSEVVWTIVVIGAGLAVNVAMLIRHRDYAFAAVAIWAFVGIALKRSAVGTPEGSAVLTVAIVAAAVVALTGVVVAFRRGRRLPG